MGIDPLWRCRVIHKWHDVGETRFLIPVVDLLHQVVADVIEFAPTDGMDLDKIL